MIHACSSSQTASTEMKGCQEEMIAIVKAVKERPNEEKRR